MPASFVQAAKGTQSGGSSLSITFASAPTSGNTIFLINNNPSSVGVSTISQTGVTWVKETSFTSSFSWVMDFWRGTVGAGAGTTVNITYSGATQGCAIAEEWTGLVPPILDKTATSGGTYVPNASSATATDTGTTATTTTANELWWGTIYSQAAGGGTGAQTAPTNGFSINTTVSGGIVAAEQLVSVFKTVSSTGTAQCSTTINGGTQNYGVGIMLTYRNTSATPASQVQSKTKTTTSASSVSITLTSSPTDGNTLILSFVNQNGGAGAITSISQTGAHWVKDNSATPGYTLEVWRASNVSQAGKTITLTLAGSTNSDALVEEWTGVLDVLDQYATNFSGPSSSNVAATAATLPNTNQYELFWGAIEAYPSANNGTGALASPPTNGFTINTTQQDGGVSNFARLSTVYRTMPSQIAVNTFATISSAFWTAAVATFKAASATARTPRVQIASNSASSTTSVVVTLGTAPTNGNFLVLEIYNSSTTISSVTSTGTTWHLAKVQNNGGINVYIYYAYNLSGAGSAITINSSGTADLIGTVAEYSGILASSDPLDQVAGNNGNSTTVDSGTTSTISQSNELFIAALTGSVTSIGSPSNGFSQINSTTVSGSQTLAFEEKTNSIAQTQSTITSGSSPFYTMSAIAGYAATAPVAGSSNTNQLMMMGVGT